MSSTPRYVWPVKCTPALSPVDDACPSSVKYNKRMNEQTDACRRVSQHRQIQVRRARKTEQLKKTKKAIKLPTGMVPRTKWRPSIIGIDGIAPGIKGHLGVPRALHNTHRLARHVVRHVAVWPFHDIHPPLSMPHPPYLRYVSSQITARHLQTCAS